MNSSDEFNVKRAKEGDRSAFDSLYQKYKKRIFNYIYRIVGNRAIAEELTQETFLKAYTGLKTYREQHFFQAWLYRIAGNVAKNEIRALSYRPKMHLEDPISVSQGDLHLIDTIEDKESSPDLVARRNELEGAIEKVLEMLSVEHRQVITLCDIQGLSYEETARILNVSTGTIASRLSRARSSFNRQIKIKYDLKKDAI